MLVVICFSAQGAAALWVLFFLYLLAQRVCVSACACMCACKCVQVYDCMRVSLRMCVRVLARVCVFICSDRLISHCRRCPVFTISKLQFYCLNPKVPWRRQTGLALCRPCLKVPFSSDQSQRSVESAGNGQCHLSASAFSLFGVSVRRT